MFHFKKLVTTIAQCYNSITTVTIIYLIISRFSIIQGELCDKYIIPHRPSKYNQEFRHTEHRYKLQHTISR